MSTTRTDVFVEPREQRVGRGERAVVRGRHVDAPHQVDDGDARAAHLADPEPAAGRGRRVVRGAQQARLARDVVGGLALVEDVVAGGHHVDAGGEQLLGHRGRDGEAAREVLGVHHGEVNRVLLAQILYALKHRHPPGPRHHVSDHQNSHRLKSSKW
jgi:hypothetical protein